MNAPEKCPGGCGSVLYDKWKHPDRSFRAEYVCRAIAMPDPHGKWFVAEHTIRCSRARADALREENQRLAARVKRLEEAGDFLMRRVAQAPCNSSMDAISDTRAIESWRQAKEAKP